jgi:nicotinate-nucleotide pyrophosphorylase (carboxylating)
MTREIQGTLVATTREQRIEKALYRGGTLKLDNPEYLSAVRTFMDVLLGIDRRPRDLTVEALGLKGHGASATIVACEPGVAAGLEEFAFLVRGFGVNVSLAKNDGDLVERGEALLQAEGERATLLSLERVGLNLLQRMSGIATTTLRLQERVRDSRAEARIVATRKTPWGLLDKRAVHLGTGGTHRLGLGDAIVIKDNHLALLANREEEAARLAISRAWKFRRDAAFIEVEVRSSAAAVAAGETFRRLQESASELYPCLIMLDNMTPDEGSQIIETLRKEGVWEHTLVEASGGISETNVEAYAASGVDAISVGALTHSPRALDISQRII